MKINWMALSLSVLIATIGSSIIFIAMYIKTQDMFPVWLSVQVSILIFILWTGLIYIYVDNRKKKK